MTEENAEPDDAPLAANEIWVYAPSEPAGASADGGFTAKGLLGKKDQGLRRVTVSDDDLAQLASQVSRVVRVLDSQQAAGDAERDRGRYQVDSITVHLGVSATGRVFFIAEAGMDASIEIAWKRA